MIGQSIIDEEKRGSNQSKGVVDNKTRNDVDPGIVQIDNFLNNIRLGQGEAEKSEKPQLPSSSP